MRVIALLNGKLKAVTGLFINLVLPLKKNQVLQAGEDGIFTNKTQLTGALVDEHHSVIFDSSGVVLEE